VGRGRARSGGPESRFETPIGRAHRRRCGLPVGDVEAATRTTRGHKPDVLVLDLDLDLDHGLVDS
jgi:hypothetical protein